MNNNTGEIILYQPDNTLCLEVRLESDTVWLTQNQISELFGTQRPAITKHLSNIFNSLELLEDSVCSILEHTANDGKVYHTKFYNLDAIISVGYRVNSINATLFRIWATKTLKEYILRGYAIRQHIERVEKLAIETEYRVSETEKKIDFFVKTALPPVEGLFHDGQVFDAYNFVSDLIKSAKKSIILIDNYIDDSVLLLLSKRNSNITTTVYTAQITDQLQLDLQRHNAQYQPITVELFTKSHDRFLIVDDVVYHFGASLKDLGKKLFAFSKMGLNAEVLLKNIIV
jgi:hypothetical protein